MARGSKRDGGKERFWRRMVRLWQRSGLTVRGFCDDRNLSEPSFYSWRRTIAERDQQVELAEKTSRSAVDEQPAFVSLGVVPAPSTPTVLELVLGSGRFVRVPSGFDAATLRQLLAVLEEGPSC